MIKIIILITSLFISSLFGHQTGLSYIDIKESKADGIDVVYKKPLSDKKGKDIHIRYPSNCSIYAKQRQTIVNGFIIDKYKLDCASETLKHSRIWVDGLVSSDRGVMIRYENDKKVSKALLRSTTPYMLIDQKNTNFDLFIEYVELGISHIWSGYDHLLFVLSLLLLAQNLKAILFAITAFTLSHSITLACGILGIIHIGVPYIESMIALSIVFLARELLMHSETLTKKHLGIVAFIFGLLHGFGFSTALRDIGLPQDEIPLSLFSFNLGIEIGQLIFILVVSALLALVKRYIPRIRDIDTPLAYIIGIISSFWLIERILSF